MIWQPRPPLALAAAVLFGTVLIACGRQTPAAPSAPRADAGVDTDAAVDEPPGFGFTRCVNGLPVAFGSSVESGGVAPDLPELTTRAARPVPPLSGGTLLALADGTTLVASDPERDQLYVIDTGRDVLRATVPLEPGDEPGRLVEDGAGRVHVVLRRGGALLDLDPHAGAPLGRRAVCPAPRGLAYEAAADQLHVACAGGELVSLPAAPGAVTRTRMLEPDLRDVVAGARGSLLVSTFRGAEVLVLAPDGRVTERLVPGSGAVAMPGRPPDSETRTPSVAWRMLPLDLASGSVLVLHQTGVAGVVDSAPGGYTGPGDCGAIVQPAVALLAPGQPAPPLSTGFDRLTLAIDLAVSPDRRVFALAVAGNGPAQGPTLFVGAVGDLPGAGPPSGEVPLGCAPAVNQLRAQPAGQVVAVAYSGNGTLFAQTREPAALWRADTGTAFPLAAGARTDTGHFLFHANSGGGLACASCHPEGAEDGRVWNLVCSGARRTQSLRGGIGGTAPLHWDGAEADLAFLVQDVFSGRMAGPLVTVEQTDALAAWIESIPPLPPPADLDRAAVARGRALFEDTTVGCAACHGGARFTNNATVDVGTGHPYQVPSLLGVAWRAPLMHDGCAATPSARFTARACGGGDAHGVTSRLGAAAIADLIAYLRSL
jgi:hypothetical protein